MGAQGPGGHDSVIQVDSPNTPPADVSATTEPNHSSSTEVAGAAVSSSELAPSVTRPMILPNFKLALQANLTRANLGSEKDRPICVDEDKHDGKNRTHHVMLLQMRLREIVQVEITEDHAVQLLNKAAPATLTNYQYQPSDIDNAVA